ncbi:tol-pal system-associated acyl-CoA thioesterase [Thalassotalea atypica]|uniref:tol-pal system-associated acyl-CoA thioesterase n=1 Tax=Thalassotalea atypica TaxID=2054316 RepID=UPI0025736E48|nr:tol-pal system-associated acyl-CoA thioesterase [Thalassotalea atypica]
MPLTTHQLSIRVYYEDTDAGGIVYYANYLKYSERARTEWLRSLDINQSNFLEHSLGFVVRKVEMDNIASAKLDDLITVSSQILELKKASIVFNQIITNQHHQELCRVKVKVACVDFARSRPCAIPSTILGALKSVS